MCRFFGFKSCITVTFVILVKVHFWEKSGSGVKCKNAPGQTDWLLGPIMLCLYSRGPFLDFENDLDRNFNHYANMSMNFFFFFNWGSPHARLNSHYEAWSYKKKSTKKTTGYRKFV